jgi:hypothetical protein
MARAPNRRHNGGPPLNDYQGSEWGRGGIRTYFAWKAAHQRAWRGVTRDVMLFRQSKAEALGVTYEEYTLELLERGRHLQAEDRARLDAIKSRRGRRQPR